MGLFGQLGHNRRYALSTVDSLVAGQPKKRCRTCRSIPTRRDHGEEVERPERFFWDSRDPTSAPGVVAAHAIAY